MTLSQTLEYTALALAVFCHTYNLQPADSVGIDHASSTLLLTKCQDPLFFFCCSRNMVIYFTSLIRVV